MLLLIQLILLSLIEFLFYLIANNNFLLLDTPNSQSFFTRNAATPLPLIVLNLTLLNLTRPACTAVI